MNTLELSVYVPPPRAFYGTTFLNLGWILLVEILFLVLRLLAIVLGTSLDRLAFILVFSPWSVVELWFWQPIIWAVHLAELLLRGFSAGGILWWVLIAPLLCYMYFVYLRFWSRMHLKALWRFWVIFGRHTTLGWLLELACAWLLRGSRAPPAVVPAEVVNFPGVPAPVVHIEGLRYATASQVAHASVATGGFTPARLRRRARWVSALQDYLGGRDGAVGRLVKGRWLPDLPRSDRPASVNAVLATLDGGAKLLGGGALRTTDPGVCEPFLVVQMEHGREIVVPNLLGSLCRNTFGRERDAALLASLRSRAVEWCKDKKVCSFEQPLIIPGHVALALRTSAPERFAHESLAAAGISLYPDR